ncbi:Dnmt3c [Symbiodinium natans]|uniref:Dnmt3c protein n=1 Tax=Symbiodinium natans TaxID=878477 RepID=A0A812UJ18_9DINO|nr:Dnmt3c [Symbiodinium natans]
MTEAISAPYGEEDEEEERLEDTGVGLMYSTEQMESWVSFMPEAGSVVVGALPAMGEGPTAYGAFGILEAVGERLYVAKYFGTNDHGTEGRHKGLGKMFNTRSGKLHFCLQGCAQCEVHQSEDVLHVDSLTWWPPLFYQGDLCTLHGKKALKDFNAKFEEPEPLQASGPHAQEDSPRQRGAPGRKDGLPGQFFEGLAGLAARAGVGGKPPPSILRPKVTWADMKKQAPSREAPALTSGQPTAHPGAQRMKEEIVEIGSESGKSGSPARGSHGSKPRSLADRVIARSVASQATKRRTKKKKKKGKKKARKRGKGSSRTTSSEESSGSKGGSSSEKELMPPVKRKAEKKPGAVMEELVEHARAQLSERERGEGRESLGSGPKGEVKMSLFFQLFWRSKFEHRPRDQRELFLLSRCADLLRDGHLNELADAIAGRIMALEVAASTGSWNTAKYLEVETMDSGSIARPETLLAAQRHARLVAKSESSWKRGDGNWSAVPLASLAPAVGRARAAPLGWLRASTGPGRKAGNRVNSEVECLLRGEVAKLLERGSSGFDRVDLDSIWKELDKAVLSYTGEEILPLRPLTVEQMEPALPPAGAGGRVNALDLVDGGTKRFLSDPRLSMLQSSEIEPGPCRAKVHVSAGAGAAVARLLVERGVCKPMKLSDVGCVANERILNGLFGVPKPKTLEDGRPVLRTIINLIPSNRVQKIIGGHIESLPAIAKWQSIILGEGETLTAFQCDMACAFYLFSLPDVWLPWFCLNFDLSGHELGIESDERFTIACCTLPMGWKSAVGVMQCISRRVLLESRLPESHEIRKDRSVPPWLIKCWREGGQHSWWQVYLDNFISCQVESPSSSQSGKDGAKHFRAALDGWDSFGILCASDKNVEFAGVAHELGAEIDGDLGKLSGGTARLWKTCVASLGQVLLGKALFAIFSEIWKAASVNCPLAVKRRASVELFMAVLLSPLCCCDLSRQVHPVVVATDASEKGGAICVSTGLSWSGKSLACAWSEPSNHCSIQPLLVISLFNGIGGAFRAYDLAGVRASGLVSIEWHKPANRVVKRAWPHALQYEDVSDVDRSMVREWVGRFPSVKEVHVWGGFPCVHLSSARHGRKNLAGEGSNLFFKLYEVIGLVAEEFDGIAKVKWVVENVSSMDVAARDEISTWLGVAPLRLDPADVLCYSRPRFAWISEWPHETEGASFVKRKGFVEVCMTASEPPQSQWARLGWHRVEPSSKLPTFMKSIPRAEPPPAPAGLGRTPQDALERWAADCYRFPPYQYKEAFLLSDGDNLRYPDAGEREILMGYGARHTAFCLPASEAKKSARAVEDERLSLVGDSFSVLSFGWVAGQLCRAFRPELGAQELLNVLGLAPGHCARPGTFAPMGRWKDYGSSSLNLSALGEEVIASKLCLGANHTGSDVRISTGELFAPSKGVRQSVDAVWWTWKQVYQKRWKFAHHINAQEMRALLLSLQWRASRYRRAVRLLWPFVQFVHTFSELDACAADWVELMWGRGELLSLKLEDVQLGAARAVLNLRLTKTSRRAGAFEAVTVSDAAVVEALRTLVSIRAAQGLPGVIWMHSAQRFRTSFRHMCSCFHLQNLNFQPYSLRRGGGTFLLQHGVALEQILLRGRWQSLAAARVYLQDGLANLTDIRLSTASKELLSRFNSHFTASP